MGECMRGARTSRVVKEDGDPDGEMDDAGWFVTLMPSSLPSFESDIWNLGWSGQRCGALLLLWKWRCLVLESMLVGRLTLLGSFVLFLPLVFVLSRHVTMALVVFYNVASHGSLLVIGVIIVFL